MKSKLHNFGNTHNLQCKSPIVLDTDLVGVGLGGVAERLCERLAKPFSTEVLDTNFLNAPNFPLACPCPKLIQECIHMYNVSRGNKLKKDGSILLSVNRETISDYFT